MPAVYLDYQRKLKPFPRARAVLLACAVATLVAGGGYYVNLAHQAAAWEKKSSLYLETAKRKGLVAWVEERDSGRLTQEIKGANHVLREITVPWDRLFEAVEASGGKEVALLALDPDTEKRTVKISGEAKNLVAVLNYVRTLKTQPEFDDVQLQNHQIQQQDPEKPVRFTLTADWRGLP